MAVRDTRVDDRREPQLDDGAQIDPCRRAGEVERRDLEVDALPQGDLRHGLRHGQGLAQGGQPHEADDGRRGRHRHSPHPHRLHDGAVAHVRVGILRAKPREVHARRHGRRGGEPLVPEAADPNAELDAVPAHHRDDGAVGDLPDRARHGLGPGHGEVQEELIVVGQEPQDGREGRSRGTALHERGRDRAEEQAGRGDVALVQLVAHGEGAGHQREQRHPAEALDRRIERGGERLAHPPQAGDHRPVVGSEPEHGANPLVQRSVGRDSVFGIPHFPHRHGRGDDPGHGTNHPRVASAAARH